MADVTIHPFLMFEGKAEEAMNFYGSLYPSAKILDQTLWREPARAGRLGHESQLFHWKPDRPVH